MPIADSASAEWEAGLQAWPSGEIVCAIWKQRDPGDPAQTWFRCGQRGQLPALAVPVAGPWSVLILIIALWLATRRHGLGARTH